MPKKNYVVEKKILPISEPIYKSEVHGSNLSVLAELLKPEDHKSVLDNLPISELIYKYGMDGSNLSVLAELPKSENHKNFLDNSRKDAIYSTFTKLNKDDYNTKQFWSNKYHSYPQPVSSDEQSCKENSNRKDTRGVSVTRHLGLEDNASIAARKIQVWWSQRYRVRTLHQSIFRANANDTSANRVELPERFASLDKQPLPPLMTTATHASTHIGSILHDGVIYPANKHPNKGISSKNDRTRQDHRLIFTSPFSSYGKDKLVLKLPEVLNLGGEHLSKAVYFKFVDWVYGTPIELSVTPEIKFSISYLHPDALCCVILNEQAVAEFTMPGEEFVYHGSKGLNKYLSFFVFKLIEQIPEKNQEIRKEIYDHFSSLAPDKLIEKLQSIVKQLIIESEFDFASSLKLQFEMIHSIHYYDRIVDFDFLRELIEGEKLTEFQRQMENIAPIISNSYFIIKGMLKYAHFFQVNIIVNYLEEVFQDVLAYEKETELAESLHHFPLEEVRYVNDNYLATKYQHEENAGCELYESADGLDVYRPNHGLVHTLRVMAYVPLVVDSLMNHGKKAYREMFRGFDILKIQKCLLFAIVGRVDELSFMDNPGQHIQSRKNSGYSFYDYYKGKPDYSEDELEEYMENLIEMGNPENRNPLHIVFNIAHKLDLPRCCGESTIIDKVVNYMKQFIDGERHIMALLDYSCRSIQATGDRLLYVPPNCAAKNQSRDSKLFVKLSHDIHATIEAITQLDIPNSLIASSQKEEVTSFTTRASSFFPQVDYKKSIESQLEDDAQHGAEHIFPAFY